MKIIAVIYAIFAVAKRKPEKNSYIIIIMIFTIYIAQINTQEDKIKCTLHIKIEYEITMLTIYKFEFTITACVYSCDDLHSYNSALRSSHI